MVKTVMVKDYLSKGNVSVVALQHLCIFRFRYLCYGTHLYRNICIEIINLQLYCCINVTVTVIISYWLNLKQRNTTGEVLIQYYLLSRYLYIIITIYYLKFGKITKQQKQRIVTEVRINFKKTQ